MRTGGDRLMRVQTVVLLVVCAIVLGYAFAAWSHARNRNKVSLQEGKAAEHHAIAQAKATEARLLDGRAEMFAKSAAADKETIRRLKAELSVIRENRNTENAKEPATIRENRKVGNGDKPSPVEPEPTVAEPATTEIAKLDQIISAQDKVIADQHSQIQVLTAARDSWKEAYEAEARRSTALSLALDAQKAANSSARWQGRFAGFAVGLVSGYFVGVR